VFGSFLFVLLISGPSPFFIQPIHELEKKRKKKQKKKEKGKKKSKKKKNSKKTGSFPENRGAAVAPNYGLLRSNESIIARTVGPTDPRTLEIFVWQARSLC
jgi:hypothetical protein